MTTASSSGLPLVPMLSRWNMTEQGSKIAGLLQVQYAFLELPKLPNRRPDAAGTDLWAWLFVHAPELTEMPADLSLGPHRAALELANQAKFTAGELETYERTRDEIRRCSKIAAARFAEGERKGKLEGKREAVLAVLAARSIPVNDDQLARIGACKDPSVLVRWVGRAGHGSFG